MTRSHHGPRKKLEDRAGGGDLDDRGEPGWKKGTKITFSEKGNEQPNVIPADLVFIIDEKPHEVFTREGNDLVTTQKISLAEALARCTDYWWVLAACRHFPGHWAPRWHRLMGSATTHLRPF
ncbi:unnamed protein product [Spirodela intermedia]|uniref:Chaperone DnaJ C-terminal domain-containing protein n=1 Tax=Spirodela intermedia TaxID=51605 RepID=A0A7I8JN77_SPIIN|nr:unnamed protein product [Spirodela intermedia]CAA6671530.1 unnamed protein product [Spirodela intermedia]